MTGRYPGKLPREKVQSLIDRYLQGDTLYQVARRFGIHEDTARRILRGQNAFAAEVLGGKSVLRGTPFVQLDQDQQDEAARLMATGLSSETIARRFKVCRKTINLRWSKATFAADWFTRRSQYRWRWYRRLHPVPSGKRSSLGRRSGKRRLMGGWPVGQFRDWAKCLDCGHRQMVPHREWIRASRPRCRACGGIVEPSNSASDEHASHNDALREDQRIRDNKTNRNRKAGK